MIIKGILNIKMSLMIMGFNIFTMVRIAIKTSIIYLHNQIPLFHLYIKIAVKSYSVTIKWVFCVSCCMHTSWYTCTHWISITIQQMSTKCLHKITLHFDNRISKCKINVGEIYQINNLHKRISIFNKLEKYLDNLEEHSYSEYLVLLKKSDNIFNRS